MLNRPDKKIITAEDPIEMIEPSFNQTQVQPQLGFGFPEGLRALIRPEPDTDALRLQAGRDGMRPLRLAGAQRVALGTDCASRSAGRDAGLGA